jgi:GGDEF domain-containing protein
VGRLTKRRFVLVLVECPAREAARVMIRCRETLKQGFPGALRCDVGAVSYGGSSPTNAQQLLHLAETHLAGARAGTLPEGAQAQLA